MFKKTINYEQIGGNRLNNFKPKKYSLMWFIILILLQKGGDDP